MSITSIANTSTFSLTGTFEHYALDSGLPTASTAPAEAHILATFILNELLVHAINLSVGPCERASPAQLFEARLRSLAHRHFLAAIRGALAVIVGADVRGAAMEARCMPRLWRVHFSCAFRLVGNVRICVDGHGVLFQGITRGADGHGELFEGIPRGADDSGNSSRRRSRSAVSGNSSWRRRSRSAVSGKSSWHR